MKDINGTQRDFETALFTLLENKNYHEITIHEICALARKTKMTFYHYFKDKESLLAQASINLVNGEYEFEYAKILNKETNIEEIEYQSVLATYDMVAKHYDQIQNLLCNGDTLPFEIFKNALLNNYQKYISELVGLSGYDVPSDYFSVFFFAGLYESALYYASTLKNAKSKQKAKESNRKFCRFLAKLIISMEEMAK